MEHITQTPVLDSIKEFAVENFKVLILLISSIATAHGPVPEFLEYDWSEWMPFLEVLKTVFSIIGVIVSVIMLILNYKRKKNDKSE